MDLFNTRFALTAVALGTAWALPLAYRRLSLSLAKHPSLTGHSRMAKRAASWVRAYSYGTDQWFSADGAPPAVAAQRERALQQLGQSLRDRSPKTLALSGQSRPLLSDQQLTGDLRVPFQFRELLQQHIRIGSYWDHSEGVWLVDLDGQRLMDLTGSYGVNLFGLDFYKSCMKEGVALVEGLGPALGGYHPCVADNARRICALSGMDEVSFHMSGTEAVMQAVRLARYHAGKRKLVRFAGAYHGWWDDVQPGPGNPMPPARDTLTLRDMHPRSLRLLDTRSDIACVLVNPLQALHPNRAAPSDSTLLDGSRSAAFDRAAYTAWLRELRAVCSRRGIALIFDEVFMGFRLAAGGAQAYFGVSADLVTYGKTLGGGLPVGVLCGKREWMQRYRPTRPADLCFARGTFNAHPHVMGAMNVFLRRLEQAPAQALYKDLDATWQRRLDELNQRLQNEDLPVRVAGLSTVWTTLFLTPGRYHWLFQFYLRQAGIALPWVGSGRMIFNLGFDDAAFEAFAQRFVEAAQRMAAGGWWSAPPTLTRRHIRWQLAKEMVRQYLPSGFSASARAASDRSTHP